MEIKIDTKKDSHEDIKQMIAFLQKFVNETSSYGSSSYGTYGPSDSSNSSNDDFNIPSTNMFDSSPEPEERQEANDDEVTIIEY